MDSKENPYLPKDYVARLEQVDMFKDMLERQKAFQESLGFNFDGLSMKERTELFKEMLLHTEHELHECVQELPFFKHWKDYSKLSYTDKQVKTDHAKEELVDAWHFFMNLILALGMDAGEFYLLYCKKLGINYKRQEDGYVDSIE